MEEVHSAAVRRSLSQRGADWLDAATSPPSFRLVATLASCTTHHHPLLLLPPQNIDFYIRASCTGRDPHLRRRHSPLRPDRTCSPFAAPAWRETPRSSSLALPRSLLLRWRGVAPARSPQKTKENSAVNGRPQCCDAGRDGEVRLTRRDLFHDATRRATTTNSPRVPSAGQQPCSRCTVLCLPLRRE